MAYHHLATVPLFVQSIKLFDFLIDMCTIDERQSAAIVAFPIQQATDHIIFHRLELMITHPTFITQRIITWHKPSNML
jgi:hypothetical protein